jgi:hypothetical protein
MKRNRFQAVGLVTLAAVGLAILTHLIPPLTPGVAAGPELNPAGGGGSALSINGSTFVPLSSDVVFHTGSGGGVAVTGGTDRTMRAPVILPDGAEVSGITLYYYDGTSANMSAVLWRWDKGAGLGIGPPAASVGSTGYGNVYSAANASFAVIDNRRYSYLVQVDWEAPSSLLRLMRVVVVYN